MHNKNIQYVTLDNGYKVWTKKSKQGTIPILLLHGGPGSTHEYFECFEQFLPPSGYQLIFYDQLGSYHSDQPDDTNLWNVDRFREEVEQVRNALGLNNFYLYGFSWGGILAIEYALKYQQHLKGLLLSNISASMKSYETYITTLRHRLPPTIQKQLQTYEDKGELEYPSYSKLLFQHFYSKHFCRLNPWPEPLTRTFRHKNKQVYDTMQGPNDFCVTGNLKKWNRWADLPQVHIPTLLIGAKHDVLDSHDIHRMAQLMPQAQMFISQQGSHLTFYDDQTNYFQEIICFLTGHNS